MQALQVLRSQQAVRSSRSSSSSPRGAEAPGQQSASSKWSSAAAARAALEWTAVMKLTAAVMQVHLGAASGLSRNVVGSLPTTLLAVCRGRGHWAWRCTLRHATGSQCTVCLQGAYSSLCIHGYLALLQPWLSPGVSPSPLPSK